MKLQYSIKMISKECNIGIFYYTFISIITLWSRSSFLGNWTYHFVQILQPNKYETAPNFIQLNQTLTSDCLLILLNLPVFTSSCMLWSWNCSAYRNKTILWSHHATTGKNNKQSDVKFWLHWIKFGSVSYLSTCTYIMPTSLYYLHREWENFSHKLLI